MVSLIQLKHAEAESIEKHGLWDPMPELTMNSPYVHSWVDSNTFTMGNPMTESTLTQCQSRLYPQSGTLDLDSGLRADLIVDPYGPGEEGLDPELGGEGGQQLTQILLGPLLAVKQEEF